MRTSEQKLTAMLVVFFSLGCMQWSPAQARLGEKIKTYIASHKKSLKLKDITIKQEIKYYAFSVLMNVDEIRSAPGFACGITVTARAGEIIGESMAVKFGAQPLKANNLAVEHGYRFVNEALGRNITAIAESSEKKLFQKAIFSAMTTIPQEMKFPGAHGKIVFSRSAEGNLLIAVVPAEKTGL